MNRRIRWEEVADLQDLGTVAGNWHGVVFYKKSRENRQETVAFIRWDCWKDADPDAELRIFWKRPTKRRLDTEADEKGAIENWLRKPDVFFDDIGSGVFVGING